MFHGENNKRIGIGMKGEDTAQKFLRERGYEIVERNVRQKFGEIDIVAKDKLGTVHFVEVKALSENNQLEPEDHLTKGKLAKMKKMADWYAAQNSKIATGNYQLDLVAIKIGGDEPVVRFYENIS